MTSHTRRILTALGLSLLACDLPPKPLASAVDAWARVHPADSAMSLQVARELDSLGRCIADRLEVPLIEPPDVWLLPGAIESQNEVVDGPDAITEAFANTITIRNLPPDLASIVLGHELGHLYLAEQDLSDLPAIVIEGLCDWLAMACAPDERTALVSERLLSAAGGVGGMPFYFKYVSPEDQSIQFISLDIDSDAPLDKLLAYDASDLRGPRSTLHRKARGLGFVIADRLLRQVSPRQLFDDLAKGGHGSSSLESILQRASLSTSREWKIACIELASPDIVRAMVNQLGKKAQEALAGELRRRHPAMTVDSFLASRPKVYWSTTGAELLLGEAGEFVAGLRESWNG